MCGRPTELTASFQIRWRALCAHVLPVHTFHQSFFRLYELQFNLSAQGLLDDKIAESYMLVIRMFAATEHFDEYWRIAQSEFHDDFAKYVNEQREIAVDAG